MAFITCDRCGYRASYPEVERNRYGYGFICRDEMACLRRKAAKKRRAVLEQRLDAVERERDEERRNRLGGVYWQQLMDDLAAARSRIAALEEGLRRVEIKIAAVLEDEETGERPDGTMGWGPDVTMVAVLHDAHEIARALLAEPSTTREPEPCGVCGKPCDPDWLWCTNCGTARDTDAPAEEGRE